MNICFYTETALPKLGGQEMVVDSLARQYLRLGHRVTVLAPLPRLPLRPRDRELPYRVVRHPRFYSTRNLVSWYRFFLRRLLRRDRFDVLHCHGLYPSGYLAALSKPALGVPFLLTSHGGDVYENNVRLRKPVLKRRHELAVRNADRLIAISRFTHEGFLKLGAREDQIVDIPNGVDVEPLATPAPRPDSLDPLIQPGTYLFFIGRLTKRKGVDVLLRAIASLPPDERPPLVIAGDGDEAANLRDLARTLGIESRVHFVGPAYGATKAWLFQNALCTVVPSRSWEAFGLVVLESYAAAKPVIASRHAGIADLVREGATGLLVDPESVDQLAAAIRSVTSDPARAAQMGAAARTDAEQYTWTAVAKRHIALYEDLARR